MGLIGPVKPHHLASEAILAKPHQPALIYDVKYGADKDTAKRKEVHRHHKSAGQWCLKSPVHSTLQAPTVSSFSGLHSATHGATQALMIS